MNVIQSLKSLSAYPIPSATLADIAEGAGIAADCELAPEVRRSREFRRAQAQVYIFLSEAPNVSQGGITYSFTEDERKRLRNRGEAIFAEMGEGADNGIVFGYKGEDL